MPDDKINPNLGYDDGEVLGLTSHGTVIVWTASGRDGGFLNTLKTPEAYLASGHALSVTELARLQRDGWISPLENLPKTPNPIAFNPFTMSVNNLKLCADALRTVFDLLDRGAGADEIKSYVEQTRDFMVKFGDRG